jgi:hypothetical protein
MNPIERINKEYNNRFTITTLYDEKTMAPIYNITDTLTNKVTRIEITTIRDVFGLTNEAIYNSLVESINNIISDNRNDNIQSILKQ